jgi:arsenite methyltransferase
MTNNTNPYSSDIWSTWLMHNRHGGDTNAERVIREDTARFADRVISGAHIEAGMTLLDVGTGDGLVAFRALAQVGPELNVVLTDVSAPMLAHVQKQAANKGVSNQCTFILCSADNLTQIADTSVNAVVTRAVLSYVDNKPGAFNEFYRVLRPGGRVSICEPIMRDEAFGVYMLKKLG